MIEFNFFSDQFPITRFLELDDYSESFIDNGYDDLETVITNIIVLSKFIILSFVPGETDRERGPGGDRSGWHRSTELPA